MVYNCCMVSLDFLIWAFFILKITYIYIDKQFLIKKLTKNAKRKNQAHINSAGEKDYFF